jgi:hypothetical protein
MNPGMIPRPKENLKNGTKIKFQPFNNLIMDDQTKEQIAKLDLTILEEYVIKIATSAESTSVKTRKIETAFQIYRQPLIEAMENCKTTTDDPNAGPPIVMLVGDNASTGITTNDQGSGDVAPDEK